MKRRSARAIAVQCLYIMEMNRVSADAALRTAMEEALNDNESGMDMTGSDELLAYVKRLMNELVGKKEQIDQIVSKYLQGWQVDRLSKVDREVLRLAVFEMVYSDDIPPKVAVNEAIELAKHFGTEESGKFVNGVLGKMIKELDDIKASARATQ
ncbi:transcription antitermination factor NusB [Paenibacillus thermotolerans]|uniref:transcription antitermination factor NusB n=1 Tax=Paenibacillus thermotolerans TaxID=3027807 RepID=UPI002368A517|nr:MULTISPECIES: transcription antitermination factor NusB [unclassified Paenibacillus]